MNLASISVKRPVFITCVAFIVTVLGVMSFKKMGVEFHSVDILANPEIRSTLPQISNWPTFPQIFINGKLFKTFGKIDTTNQNTTAHMPVNEYVLLPLVQDIGTHF